MVRESFKVVIGICLSSVVIMVQRSYTLTESNRTKNIALGENFMKLSWQIVLECNTGVKLKESDWWIGETNFEISQ